MREDVAIDVHHRHDDELIVLGVHGEGPVVHQLVDCPQAEGGGHPLAGMDATLDEDHLAAGADLEAGNLTLLEGGADVDVLGLAWVWRSKSINLCHEIKSKYLANSLAAATAFSSSIICW